MTDAGHPDHDSRTTLDEAVAALEANYDDLDEALDAQDAEAVDAVVSARGEAVTRLRAACGDAPLPEPIRERLAAREEAAQARMKDFDARVRERLHDGSRRAHATRRYARN
ncbi:MAG: hypothetical protein ACQEXJ_15630 [Myxococcota bacterium]